MVVLVCVCLFFLYRSKIGGNRDGRRTESDRRAEKKGAESAIGADRVQSGKPTVHKHSPKWLSKEALRHSKRPYNTYIRRLSVSSAPKRA